MSAEPITVLFVDDDQQWAQYMASELEHEDPAFSVRVAGNVNEAVIALGEDHSIDCVVTDFRMPEVDGIELLEHVSDSHPQLPVILVTGDGSEDVAARAISAGVTDYIRKDPLADQAPVFVTRIRQAVERARLGRQLRASERRYRTVIEHTRDGIVIIQDGEIVFANDRFEELCEVGVDADSRQSLSGYVHEADHELVADLIGSTHTGDDPGLCEVRLVRPTGEVRHCELLGEAISYDDDPATLLSIRDVTRRRSRERTLTREREFNQAVQQRLVSVNTRGELESEITTVLASYGYDLVWIGTVDDRGVHTRSTAGDSEYISRLEADSPSDDHGGDPVLWTGATGQPQFVPDFEALMPTTRRNVALDCGFRTGYALPLGHEEISYGILAVYHADPYRIGDAERSLLAEVAATVSFAIHHVETQQTLTSTEGIVVTVELESNAYYLSGLLAEEFDHSSAAITVDGTQIVDEGTQVQYLSAATDDPAVAGALDTHPAVRRWKLIDSGDPASYQVTVEADTPESQLGSVGALVRSTTVTAGHTTITFELSSREYLQPAIDRLNEQYGPVTVSSVVERTRETPDRSARIDLDSLTTKQLVALEAAYHQGYFDRPRRQSAVEIANSLDITHTTYLQHLRVAERKLFGQLFGSAIHSTTDRGQ